MGECFDCIHKNICHYAIMGHTIDCGYFLDYRIEKKEELKEKKDKPLCYSCTEKAICSSGGNIPDNEFCESYRKEEEEYKKEENLDGVDLSKDVRNPAHYIRLTPQPKDVIAAWELNFFLGSAIKYIARAGHKNGNDYADDLTKAIRYLEFELESKK